MSENIDLVHVLAGLDHLVTRVVREIAVKVTAELVERTPVDTGHARSNWIPSTHGTDDAVGSKEAVSYVAQAAGLAWVKSGYVLPGLITISNSADYIAELNTGTSKQAPKHFVQYAIEDVLDSVKVRG